MSTPAYGVLFRFPTQTTDCLVVMPYGKRDSEYEAKLDRRFDAIARGAQEAGLTAVRLDREAQGDFLKRLVDHIQSAAIVVADCSLDPHSSKPSPNVMYEIGLAHALGRPTILLQSDEGDLPVDLKNRDCIKFNEENPRGLTDLRTKVFTQITMAKSRLVDHPTHSDYLLGNTSIVKSRHRICLHESFPHYFSGFIKFATNIWYQLQPLDNELSTLTEHVMDLARDPLTTRKTKLSAIDRTWLKYEIAASATIDAIHRPTMEHGFNQDYVDRAFDFMLNDSEETSFADVMHTARDFFRIIKDDLSDIPKQHNEINDLYGEIKTQLDKEQYNGIRRLYLRLQAKHLGVQSCITNTHGMVLRIVSIFVEP